MSTSQLPPVSMIAFQLGSIATTLSSRGCKSCWHSLLNDKENKGSCIENALKTQGNSDRESWISSLGLQMGLKAHLLTFVRSPDHTPKTFMTALAVSKSFLMGIQKHHHIIGAKRDSVPNAEMTNWLKQPELIHLLGRPLRTSIMLIKNIGDSGSP